MSTLRDIAEEKDELEMTPMIDVTFLLLIFFLCTIEFKTLEGKLSAYLPKDLGPAPADARLQEDVVVTVAVSAPGERRDARDRALPWRGSGRYQLVGRSLELAVGPHRVEGPEALARRLAALRRQDPTRRVTIDCGPGTVYGDVVPVLDAALDAGFTDVGFAGVAGR